MNDIKEKGILYAGGMMTPATQKVVERLEAMSKLGADYEGGKRNPIRSDTGQLLYALALASRSFLALEVGTAYGLSTAYIASGMRNGGGTMLHTIEFDVDVAKAAQLNMDEAGLAVTVHAGDGVEMINALSRKLIGKFGFVFLDARKTDYLKYLLALQNTDMLMPHAIIVADNVLDRADKVKDFMAYVGHFPHTVLQTECGLLVAQMP